MIQSKKRIDVMTDIETLGTGDNATVFQISAIAFDIRTGQYLNDVPVFNQVADIAKNKELNVDGSTLKWWLNTDKELLTKLINSGKNSSENILIMFHKWLTGLGNKKDVYLWGNGILFDNRIIKAQFENIGLTYPIFYRNDRDVRTILELASFKTGLTEREIKDSVADDSLVAHNAI